jgi:type IV fimbrial biogenesis protein FimT
MSKANTSPFNSQSAFTLIELLVVITVLGVILAIAMPNLRDFLVRNKVTSLSNEFYVGLTQARTEAISKNTCVTICQSSNTQNSISGGGATGCSSTGTNDWLKGWIIVSNPSCDSSATNPASSAGAVLIRVMQPPGDGYELLGTGTARKIMFDSRGLLQGLSATSSLTLGPADANEPDKYRRTICISSAGRVTIRAFNGAACS